MFDLYRLGARLRSYRKESGLSGYKAALSSGSSSRRIYDYEAGYRTPSLRTLMQLCETYNCTPNDLLLDSSDPVMAEIERTYWGMTKD